MSVPEIVAIVMAVAAGAALKSITGLGLPIVAIPLISLFLPLRDAIAVVAFPNLVVNVALIVRERASYDGTRDLGRILSGGIVGAVIGAVALTTLPAGPIVILLAAVVAAYVALQVLAPGVTVPAAVGTRLSPLAGLLGGFFQGAVGVSGPVFGTWIHAYRLPRGAHVLALSIIFALTGLTQLVVLVADGATDDLWGAALAASVPALALLPATARLRDRLAGHHFDRLVLLVLVGGVVSIAIRTFA